MAKRPKYMFNHPHLTLDIVGNVLEGVCEQVNRKKLATYSPEEWASIYDWAVRELYHASDNILRRRPKPESVKELES